MYNSTSASNIIFFQKKKYLCTYTNQKVEGMKESNQSNFINSKINVTQIIHIKAICKCFIFFVLSTDNNACISNPKSYCHLHLYYVK